MSDAGGSLVPGSATRYLPFGDYRSGGPSEISDRGFTGQKENMELGLYYYNARYYAPGLGRFLSADTIVPDPANPLSFNRYSYALNSPLRFVDPTGHYGRDVHKEITLEIARTIGSNLGIQNSEALAVEISDANQETDDNPLTSPLNIAPRIINDYGTTVYMSPANYFHFEGRNEVIERLEYAIDQGDPELFGRALHSYQDSFSHVGSGYSYHTRLPGVIELARECSDCFAQNPLQSFLRAFFNLGHVPVPGSNTDDYSSPDSVRDRRMTNGTEYWITLFLLNEQGLDPMDYFEEEFGMTPDEWYRLNVEELE